MPDKIDDGSALIAQYAEAIRPYIECGGPIPPGVFNTRAWRYFVEINSGCNLKCALCACGNRAGYEHVNGFMDLEMVAAVADKIKAENPGAIVMPYGNSEPFLHPQLPECVAIFKKRGLRVEVASNLNHLNRLEDFLAAGPDSFFVSVSGFTQDVYSRAHIHGDIEVVKANMKTVAAAIQKSKHKPQAMVHYHMYRDTIGAEFDAMKAFAEGLGYAFIYSWARAISMENVIAYLRWLQKEKGLGLPPIGTDREGRDWNELLPPVSKEFIEHVDRLSINPSKAVEMYAKYPVQAVCPVGDIFTFIRHDGLASLCACVSDRRLVLGKYLDLSQEKMSELRRGHPICRECLNHRMNLYFHVVEGVKFNL